MDLNMQRRLDDECNRASFAKASVKVAEFRARSPQPQMRDGGRAENLVAMMTQTPFEGWRCVPKSDMLFESAMARRPLSLVRRPRQKKVSGLKPPHSKTPVL